MRAALIARFWLGCLTLVSLSSFASEWTVDDALFAERVDDVRLSADGSLALWTKSSMSREAGKAISNLFLSRLGSGEETALTRGDFSVRSPRFSPDGKRVSFVSSRPLPGEKKGDTAETQLWLLSLAGGEPWPATRLRRGIQGYAWRNGREIVFAAQEEPSLYEQTTKESKDSSIIVEDAVNEPPVRLFLLDTESGRVRRLTQNADWIEHFAVSPDGRWAVAQHGQSLSWTYDQATPPKTVLHDLANGTSIEIDLGPRRYASRFEWQKDGSGFLFVAEHSSHPRYLTATISKLFAFDLASNRAQEIDLDWPRGLGQGLPVLPTAEGALVLLADGARYQPARLTRSAGSWQRELLTGDHLRNLFDWALSEDGKTLAYQHSTPSQPAQWYRADLENTRLSNAVAWTKLNEGFTRKPTPRSEVVHWKGANDEEVEGILRYPFGYREGERYPLVLVIHGGPAAADLEEWSNSIVEPMMLLAQRGAFTFQVNYHGSGNYGLDWVESISGGKYYELEIPDIEAGVDALISRGLVDPSRLATMGWSNGGILSAALITHTRRYRAASVGAADVEWISDWGNVDFGASFDNYYFGASPLEDPQLYIRKSPFFKLPEVTTPTIVYTGTEDRNVPPSQSWSLYRALQQTGKAPVRLVLFPGEPHGPRQLVHQRRKLEEDLAWLDRYLFANARETSVLKPSSPLARAFSLAKAAHAGGRYGRLDHGALLPEMVQVDSLVVSRFEITRAQFAAFEPHARVAAGEENFPATNLTADQAQRYTEWLSKRTGEPHRLAKVSELTPLLSTIEGTGNTLDHWAGYAAAPSDADGLRQAASGLPGTAPLLSPVGRFDATSGAQAVFDLGGNASEWVLGADGKPELFGPSADQPKETLGTGEAAPAYRGFRVVRITSGGAAD